jgi:hypothetical protein
MLGELSHGFSGIRKPSMWGPRVTSVGQSLVMNTGGFRLAAGGWQEVRVEALSGLPEAIFRFTNERQRGTVTFV